MSEFGMLLFQARDAHSFFRGLPSNNKVGTRGSFSCPMMGGNILWRKKISLGFNSTRECLPLGVMRLTLWSCFSYACLSVMCNLSFGGMLWCSSGNTKSDPKGGLVYQASNGRQALGRGWAAALREAYSHCWRGFNRWVFVTDFVDTTHPYDSFIFCSFSTQRFFASLFPPSFQTLF